MGPITLIDKSTIQSLGTEVHILDRYYSLVISPILMRELLSTLAKEPKPNKDWEHRLSILASKVDTIDSYTPPSAHQIARASLMGDQTPMDGRVPLAGGRIVRSRDGTYGAIFEEPEQKKILRDWKRKSFHDYYRREAAEIRKIDHEIDLAALQKSLSEQMTHFPFLGSLAELVQWMDANFFNIVSPEYHLANMANGLISQEEFEEVLARWRTDKQALNVFSPYAFFFYRVNTIYFAGLGKGLISTSKKANTHLDIQYVYYLPFSMCFTSSDKKLLEMASVFKRDDQIIIPGEHLRADLKAIEEYFSSLNEDAAKQHAKEFGNFLPELTGSLTSATWKSCMGPRPDPSVATQKMSKKQQKALVDQLIKYKYDSVTIEGSSSSVQPLPRPKRSLVERNRAFLSGTLEKVGALEHESWEHIKEHFNSDHVKAVYNLHADFWHPSDPFGDLAAELAADDKLRVLYLGDIEPHDLAEQVLRWSLHFDQILIPDPFNSPWARKSEYNPLSNPDQYEGDTLKLVYMMMLLQPLILSGQVLLVPDPADFNPNLKHLNLTLATKKKDDPIYKEMTAGECDRMKRVMLQTELRFLARLPLEGRRQIARSKFKEIGEDSLFRYLEHIRASDPLCINSDSTEGQLIFTRSGANYESSVLLSSMYRAIPISSLTYRVKEYRRQSTTTPGGIRNLADKLQSTPNFKIIDPFFSVFAMEKGALREFRDSMRQCLAQEQNDAESLVDLFVYMAEEAHFLSDVFSHRTDVDREKLIETTKIDLVWSNDRFLTPNAVEYIDAYNPALKATAPKCFLGLPTTSITTLPY